MREIKIISIIFFFGIVLSLAHPSAAREGVEEIVPDEWRTVIEARLDLVYNDGTIFLFSHGGEDYITLHDEYRLIFMDTLSVKVWFSRLGGKLLVAHVAPPEAAAALPRGMEVSIAKENLAKPARLKADKPEKIQPNLKPITSGMLRTRAPFGITAQVSLISSDKDMLFYFGQYTGLLTEDSVEITNALGKRILAKVRKVTADGFVDCAVSQGNAHIFHEGEFVIIRDATSPANFNFIAQPDQTSLPELPRFIRPSKPVVLPEK